MRLQAYILQEGRTKKLKEDVAVPWIKKKCSIHIKKLLSMSRPNIYRGVSGFGDKYGVVDPKSSSERKSANTSNHTTLLMDNLPSWKKYPKRSQSLVCSTNHVNAATYGSLYYVYPSNKCNIGIVPTQDVWESFRMSWGQGVPTFNDIIQRDNISDSSWSKMKTDLIKFYEVWIPQNYRARRSDIADKPELVKSLQEEMAIEHSKVPGVGTNRMIYDYIMDALDKVEKGGKPSDVIKHFDNIMNPKKNGFSLNNLSMKHDNNEIWIGDAPVFLINVGEMDSLIKMEMM